MSAGVAVGARPGPEWWTGRFFPGSCEDRHSFFEREVGATIAVARHLPVAANLRAVLDRFGPRAASLVRDWRALWDSAVPDVDALAEILGTEAAAEPAGLRRDAEIRARRKLDAGDAAEAAGALHWALAEAPVRVRDRVLHVVEDAAVHLALSRADRAFALLVRAGGSAAGARLFGKAAGERGLRPLRDGEIAGVGPGEWGDRADTPYWTLPAFRERAGRSMALANGHAHLVMILADMAAQGHARAFLKAVECKAGTWVVPTDPDPARADRLLAGALGPATARLGSGKWRERAMLVQELVPFRREHRFVVVGDRVVAATPSVRDLGVLDADRSRLGAGVAGIARPATEPGAYDRGRTTLVADRGLLARMALGARGLARDLAAERAPPRGVPGEGRWRLPDRYVVDMGETLDGRVLPIEINGLRHAGLYAADPARIAAAIDLRETRAGPVAPVPADEPGVAATGPVRDLPAGMTRVREYLTVDSVFSTMVTRDPAYAAPIPGWAAEGAALDPDALVVVHAALDAHPREAMSGWGPGAMPGPWLTRPPAGRPGVRGTVSGRSLGHAGLADGKPLPRGVAVVLCDGVDAEGARVGIGPFAGLSEACFEHDGPRGDALPPAEPCARAFPPVPEGPGLESLALALTDSVPSARLDAIARAHRLGLRPDIGTALREAGPGATIGEAAARYGLVRGAAAGEPGWEERLLAECREEAANAWRETLAALGRSAHGAVSLSMEIPLGAGDDALGEALRAAPLGRRWRFRHERRRDDERDGVFSEGTLPGGGVVVDLEARVSVAAVDVAATVAEGMAWRLDLAEVVLLPGAEVVLRAAYEAWGRRAVPGLGALRRRLVAVDAPVPASAFA